MNHHSPKALESYKPEREFFIGIDSDGCAFDTMEIKHKECFCPQYIKSFGLQPVSRYAREAWEFANLYSVDRGANRFKTLLKCIDLLARRPEVLARRVQLPDMRALREWANNAEALSNGPLKEHIKSHDAPILKTTLEWSLRVNEAVADIVSGVPPFPLVEETLLKAAPRADMMVVSATPCEALEREWEEHGIARHVRLIAGQEMGSKSQHLATAAKPHFPGERILMIGDAPGDMKAARSVGALYFPIVPHHEESWQRLHDEALDRFLAGTYKGAYEDALVAEFEKCLPTTPPWKEVQ
jgi:phosphoglycolate phosphatase-like HAD superfamily hydrolase